MKSKIQEFHTLSDLHVDVSNFIPIIYVKTRMLIQCSPAVDLKKQPILEKIQYFVYSLPVNC